MKPANRIGRAREAVQVWWMTHYYRAIKRFSRFLIRVIFWRRKEQDEDDFMFAGQALPLHRIPIRSVKADGKRKSLEYARWRSGDPNLSWGQARKRIARWEREERERNARRRGRAPSSGRGPRGVAPVHGGGNEATG